MSSKQSFLSAPKFGYDIAVGVTQASVNATMKQYLDGLPIQEAVICFVADEDGNPKQIEYDQLKKNANGADPFSIPDKENPKANKDIKKLMDARFITGFKARIGLPPGVAPDKIPDVVTLDSDTSFVTFTLMCAEFMAVQLVLDGYGPAKWVNVSQDPQSPVRFTSKVDLRQIQADSDKLPPAVKKQREEFIKAGYGFTIQQLFMDLDTAFGSTTPDIAGIDPGSWLYTCLDRYFVRMYLKTLKANPVPVLGYTFKYDSNVEVLASTLPITNTTMAVSPYVDAAGDRIPAPTPIQRELSTLNYQCTVNNKKTIQPISFNWNWAEINEISDFDGVMAINRNTFANYLHDQLVNHVKTNCYDAMVRVWLEGVGCYYSWGLKGNRDPKVTFTQTGPNVLNFSYSSEGYDTAGSVITVGKMCMRPNFDVTVTFLNNAITIKQRLVIWLEIGCLGQSANGNVIDRTITDTYELTIENNRLIAKQKTTTEDRPTMGSVGVFFNFFTGVDSLTNNVAGWLQNVTQTKLTSLPLSVVQDFIFPGGNAFAFKKVMFSDNQDLISHITYLAPETATFLNVPNNR
jgi:hypothetical protein